MHDTSETKMMNPITAAIAALGLTIATSACATTGGGGGGGGDDGGDMSGPPDGGSVDDGPEVLPDNLIDNLDDGDGVLPVRNGRVGAWYTYNDMTPAGTQVPAAGVAFLPSPGGPGESVYCASTQGEGFSIWGAGMGFDLNNDNDPPGTKEPYDASAFQGITFKARGTVPIRAAVMVSGVLSTAVGGTCTPSMAPGEGCDDGHGRAILLTPEWKSYQLDFDQITQAGWGKPVPFDPAAVMAVQFNADKNLEFDVQIDEIGFY